MKAYLIDPFEQTITEVEHDGKLETIYALIQCGDSGFDLVHFGTNRDGIFVDDEGLYKKDQRYFVLEGFPSPLAGRGLVTGCDDEGETVAPKISLRHLVEKISWAPPTMRFSHINTTTGTVMHPVFGKAAQIVNDPVFVFDDDPDPE